MRPRLVTNMGVFTKLDKPQIKKLLSAFPDVPRDDFKYEGVRVGTVNTYYRIVFPKYQVFYLKIDEVGEERRLKNEIRILNNLYEERRKLSFVFPRPLKTKGERPYIPFRRKFALVFPEVPGKSLFKGLTTGHLKTVGEKMAELHGIDHYKSIRPHRFNMAGLVNVYTAIEPRLAAKHPSLDQMIRKKITLLSSERPTAMKEVLIHADLFPENVHWEHDRFVGMIDFEAAGRGAPLFDICVAIHSFCLKKNRLDPSKASALLAGYQRLRPLTQRQKRYFEYFLELTALRFLLTRLKDFELPGVDPREENFKDYREYVRRFDELEEVRGMLA